MLFNPDCAAERSCRAGPGCDGFQTWLGTQSQRHSITCSVNADRRFSRRENWVQYRRQFPRSLDRAPFLLPTDNTVIRRALNQWFDNEKIQLIIIGEFENGALLNGFGQFGEGLFAAPSAIDDKVQSSTGRPFERKLKHPAAIAICESAKKKFFI